MKVLVTGSNGFVGSHIVETLLNEGHTPLCLVRHTSDCKWLKNLNVKCFTGDVTDAKSLIEPVKSCDAIIHNAGILRAKKTEDYFKVNCQGTKNLVETVLTHNTFLKKFTYISSQAAMGPSTSMCPKFLSEPEKPVSDYGKSKLAGEKELSAFNESVPYTILRPAAVYGPRDKDIFIFFNLVKLHLRPKTTKKRYIQLTFVKDVSKTAVETLTSKITDFRTYFIAEDSIYSWEEVGKTIAKENHISTVPLPLPDFAFHMTGLFSGSMSFLTRKPAVLNSQKVKEMLKEYWIADTTPAKKDLKTVFTKFKIGAKITFNWYKENNWF